VKNYYYPWDMADTKANQQLLSLVVRGVLFSSLFIETWILINPANLERLLMLFVFVGGLLGLIRAKNFRDFITVQKSAILFFGCFAIWSCVVMIISDRDFFQQLYGDYGRNSGFALYLGLSLLALLLSSINSRELVSKLVGALVIAGAISTVYGVMQRFNIDVLGWERGGEITGLFGNSNFQSSFLGITSITVFTLILFPNIQNSKRWVMPILLSLSLWNIWDSNSIQGFFVFSIGSSIVVYFKLASTSYGNLKNIYGIVVGVGGIVGGLGIFQIGPLASVLSFKTIEIREFYWSAGIEMIKNSPIFGSGYDSYGDLYRQFRSQESIIEFGPELVSTAAHNVFIDLGVNGGMPLLLSYVALMLLTINRSIRVFRRESLVNPFFLAIFASWIGYLVQLFVSMNQISIAIWGWVLMGSLLGYERFTRTSIINTLRPSRKLPVEFGLDPSSLIRFIGGGLVGLLLILPPFVSEAKFRSALESSDGQKIRDAALVWPRNPSFMVKSTEIFRDNKLVDMSKEMAIKTVEQFPASVYGWRMLISLENVDPKLLEKAKVNLGILDPLNTNSG
jgi:O-antigen ligase